MSAPALRPPRRPRRGWALAIALLLVLLTGGVAPAQAETPSPEAGASLGPTAIGQCLASGQVWLFVSDGTQILSNQCVGNPKSGTAALNQGGLTVKQGNGGLICSLNGIPGKCPSGSTYDYWTYFHATQDSGWSSYQYSQLGANGYQPPAASIEAWCFSTGSTSQGDHCTPQPLRIVKPDGSVVNDQGSTPTVTANPPVKQSGQSPLATIGVGAAIVLLIIVGLVWSRRTRRRPDSARR